VEAVEANVVAVKAVPVPPRLKVMLKLPVTHAEAKLDALKEKHVRMLTPSIVKTVLARPTVETVKVAKAEVPGATTRKPKLVKLLKEPRLMLPANASLVKTARIKLLVIVSLVRTALLVKIADNLLRKRRSKNPLRRKKSASLLICSWLRNQPSLLV